ncbi:MAG: hypothetical protein HY341_02470 [Candidatus Kerfeldbacteria bacterium]|nr:hypothetical protein [Candidatus Kerfeldbacteria bacterium]
MTHTSAPVWMQTRATNLRHVTQPGVYVTLHDHVVVVDQAVLRHGALPMAFGWKVDGLPVPRDRQHACQLVVKAGLPLPVEVRLCEQITIPGVWITPNGEILRLYNDSFRNDGTPALRIGPCHGRTFVFIDMDPDLSPARVRSRARELHRAVHL